MDRERARDGEKGADKETDGGGGRKRIRRSISRNDGLPGRSLRLPRFPLQLIQSRGRSSRAT